MFENSNLHFFPRGVGRLGGASFEGMTQLDFSEEYKIQADDYFSLLSTISKEKDKIEKDMFALIKEQADNKIQNKLLKFKRKITGSSIASEALEEVGLSVMEESLKSAYFSWKRKLEESFLKKSSLEEGFQKELNRIRSDFQVLVNDKHLKNGLLLASNSLLERIPSFCSKSPEEFRKKESQIELSLYQYYSRMTAKTSPFSTFNHLVEVGVGQDNTKEIAVQQSSGSKIRLNNYLWFYYQSLFRKLPDLLKNFVLRLNPTLRSIGEQYEFLTNFNNVESFQKIPVDPVLELFEQVLAESEGLLPEDLVAQLLQAIDADAEELEVYISQLVQYGFLEVDWEISGLDAYWDLKLVQKLEMCKPTESIQICLNGLKKTRDLCTEYENADLEKRKELIELIYQTILSSCMELHELAGLPEEERQYARGEKIDHPEKDEADKKKDSSEEKDDSPFKGEANTYFYFKKENVIYEDSSVTEKIQMPEEELTELMKVVDTLQDEINIFEGFLSERRRLKEYFIERYKKGDKVPVLEFYEAYYRDKKLPALEKEKEIKEAQAEGKKVEVEKDELLLQIEKKREKWLKEFNSKISAAEDCFSLKTSLLSEVNGGNNHAEPETPGSSSYGLFLQTFYEDGKMKAMLNIPSGGFGKCFSRFLHLFDSSFIDDLRVANREFSEGELAIENCDSSFFNANLHPPLFDYEIKAPGSQNALGQDSWIQVTELYFAMDEKEEKLELRHQKGDSLAWVYDLGFQVFDTRSQLYQLLGNFTRMRFRLFFHLQNIINAKGASQECLKGEEIWKMPRIEVDGKIVIQRKSWNVPNAKFPSPEPAEDLSSWYVRLDLWRREQGIPEQVFVSIPGARELDRLPEKLRKKLTKDDYKPQYISFASPLSMRVLDKMAQKAPYSLKIEEMLPSPSQMMEFEDGRHVSEMLFQWFKKEEND